jgi:hypothetical protein
VKRSVAFFLRPAGMAESLKCDGMMPHSRESAHHPNSIVIGDIGNS